MFTVRYQSSNAQGSETFQMCCTRLYSFPNERLRMLTET